VFKLENDAIAICIADACGKGMPAALLMANLQAAVKTFGAKCLSPKDLCANVNRLMCENMAGHGFITFFYAVIDSDASGCKRCTFCNAGHNPPILVRSDGTTLRLDSEGGVLGVFSDWQYEQRDLYLASGDRMVMYTDGITEIHDTAGAEFGENRLIDLLRSLHDPDARSIVDQTIALAEGFGRGRFDDDVTVVAVTVGELESPRGLNGGFHENAND
jgi:sigma-B regulation protein RsbU (phosphoserine phosphatase)